MIEFDAMKISVIETEQKKKKKKKKTKKAAQYFQRFKKRIMKRFRVENSIYKRLEKNQEFYGKNFRIIKYI